MGAENANFDRFQLSNQFAWAFECYSAIFLASLVVGLSDWQDFWSYLPAGNTCPDLYTICGLDRLRFTIYPSCTAELRVGLVELQILADGHSHLYRLIHAAHVN